MDEINEVLEGGVQMSLFCQVDDMLEVGVVYVGIHSKQTLEDRLGDGYKVPREGHAWRGG